MRPIDIPLGVKVPPGTFITSFITIIFFFTFSALNVALKGASSQSSLYNNFGDSRNSIDGSLSSDYSKIQCSQTIWELRPWWTVDLKEVHAVFSVAVTNREDCCWEWINEAEIRIGDSREWGNNPRLV